MGSFYLLHASLTEYVLFFGTAVDTSGHSGICTAVRHQSTNLNLRGVVGGDLTKMHKKIVKFQGTGHDNWLNHRKEI